MSIKKTIQNIALATAALTLSTTAAYAQTKENQKTREDYYNSQFFHDEDTRAQDEQEMGVFSISNPDILRELVGFGDFRLDTQGDKVKLYFEEKEVAIYETTKQELYANPDTPQKVLDMISGVTAREKEIDCLEKELDEMYRIADDLTAELEEAKNFRRNLTLEPGVGFTYGLNDFTDKNGNPLIEARVDGIISFGGRKWPVRPLAYVSLPIPSKKNLEDEVSTYDHRYDSPSGNFHVITTREVNKQEDIKKNPVLGAGLRLYPSKRKDLHLDFMAGFVPGQYMVTSTHTETDLNKVVFDKNGFPLQEENATLGTYDEGSSVERFNRAEIKAGFGTDRVAVYFIYGKQVSQVFDYQMIDNPLADSYVGATAHIKLGFGKGNK